MENNLASDGLQSWLLILVIVPLIKLFIYDSNKTIIVNQNGFQVSGWFIQHKKVSWKNILAVKPSLFFFGLFSKFTKRETGFVLSYKNAHGKMCSIKIGKGIPNLIRFKMMAENEIKK